MVKLMKLPGKMVYHLGRLIDHVHIRAADLEASRRFYRSILTALGRSGFREGPLYFSADEIWIDRADGQHSRIHLAHHAIVIVWPEP